MIVKDINLLIKTSQNFLIGSFVEREILLFF